MSKYIALLAFSLVGYVAYFTSLRTYIWGFNVGECLKADSQELNPDGLIWQVAAVGHYQYLLTIVNTTTSDTFDKASVKNKAYLVECPKNTLQTVGGK